MTFDDLKRAVKDHCNLTSDAADARIGASLNAHYKRITAKLGMDAARDVTRTVSTTLGQQAVTFTNIEKIHRILDTTDTSNIRLLMEVSLHQQRSTQPTSGQPTSWAARSTTSSSVTVLLDTVPQSAYTLQADGVSNLTDLTGDDEPAFPSSFHSMLAWYVISEELLKKEKDRQALVFQQKADTALSDLVFQYADSHTLETRQRDSSIVTSTGSGGSGGGNQGGTSYTQTGLITFDRDPDAPFAVSSSSAVVTNLDADKLDGQHGTYYLDRANHTGTLQVADIPAHASTHISGGSDAIKLDDLAAPDDNTDLNASTAKHGLLPKLSGSATQFLNGNGSFSTPTTVAGADTQVQFNDGGALAGDSGLVFNKTSNVLTAGGVDAPLVGAGGTTTALAANSANILNSATQPRMAAFHNTTQSINDSTWTVLSLNSEEFDVGAMHDTGSDTSRGTVPANGGGVYLCIGAASFAGNGTGYRGVRFLKGGATIVGSATIVDPNETDTTVLQCMALLSLSAADYIEVQAFQSSGGALNTGNASTRHAQNALYMVKLW